KGEYSIVIVAHHTEAARVEKARRQRLFDGIDTKGLSGTPAEALGGIETELLTIGGETRDIGKELRVLYKENRKGLLIIREELDLFIEGLGVFESYGVTKSTTSLTGWIEKGREGDLRTLCEDTTQGNFAIYFEDPAGEEAPTKLNNPSWATPFEGLVNMFSPPKYNEIDSSRIVGPLFIIFFGFMVGDAGYGLIIIALSLFGYLHLGKYSKEIREYAYFGLLIGITTIICGLFMGGFFYDSLQRFVYGDETSFLYPQISLLGMKFPMDPMNDPITVFLVALIIGIITLNIGIVLSIHQNIKQKNYHGLVTDNLSWVFLEPGGITLVGAYMLGAWELSPAMSALAGIATALGIILRLPVSGGLVLFDITGFVGNVLSFSRLLALALATAGLALTINIFVQLIIDIHPAVIIIAL
ncbi:MAG: hypothetical protein KAU14_01740, partial [Thermoplasmata archaeon]|nr:hypothetical protein [Thermoplasmata archaeon]